MEAGLPFVANAGRKRLGNGWCIGRAHWPVALSSEQSCGLPCKGTRARGIRCPELASACIRTCGELQKSPRLLSATNIGRDNSGGFGMHGPVVS